MDPVAERLLKLREERQAREKARIEKLRELNLKKYSKSNEIKNDMSTNLIKKTIKSEISLKHKPNESVKNISNINKNIKRPISAPAVKLAVQDPVKKISIKNDKIETNGTTIQNKNVIKDKKVPYNVGNSNNVDRKLTNNSTNKKLPIVSSANNTKAKNEIIHKSFVRNTQDKKPGHANNTGRKSMVNNFNRRSIVNNEKLKPNKSIQKDNSSKDCSVFERLYKHKITQNAHSCDVEKLKTDPNYFKKLERNTGLILNKRYTVFDKPKPKIAVPVRRSISAVHLKRISKSELTNCIHKYSSIGDKLNNIHLKHVNEDETVKHDKVISAVKSERKKVTFMTPVNFNTPRPEELQNRLKAWLQKRGKSLDSYQHLQCFGINHLPNRFIFNNKLYDEEDKENISVDSESDNDSYIETMNEDTNINKWRSASIVSDSVNLNETQDTSSTYSDALNIDDVVIGALNDLAELLREGYAWEQCARWLRAIRERFPLAPRSAAYWECRAALEERRGDLPASVQCWEEAIAKGTEQSVVEANLDQLLDKFMQLKISPKCGKPGRQVDPKLVDVKNVFKSTIIRFAVQQAKLREANQCTPKPKFCVTPVRRSSRLSTHWTGNQTPIQLGKRTPLQVCTSVRQAGLLIGEELEFVPNENLRGTP